MENQLILHWIDQLDTELVRYFAKKDMTCNPLDRAMEYTVLAGGKRIRPVLTLAACKECGGDPKAAMPLSLASELLHTYTLIHDDLPCMDDDDLRRGKPTNHIVFGEANAVLAGDALQAEAFHLLATGPYPSLGSERRLQIITEFSEAIGRRGLVAGQVMDLWWAGKAMDRNTLELLHQRKTGTLLRFAIRLGGHLAGSDERTMAHLTQYAESVGLMFQVVDDLLDEEGEGLGKTLGKDAAQQKTTFLSLLGNAGARRFADELLDQALSALEEIGGSLPLLRDLAVFICHRKM